jgi:hypothetical protein
MIYNSQDTTAFLIPSTRHGRAFTIDRAAKPKSAKIIAPANRFFGLG